MKVHTEAVQFKADAKLIDFIEKKLSKTEVFFDRIIEARVILRLENTGQVRDKVAEVKLIVPGDIIFVKEVNKTFESAIDAAVDVLGRQLVKHKEKTRQSGSQSEAVE